MDGVDTMLLKGLADQTAGSRNLKYGSNTTGQWNLYGV